MILPKTTITKLNQLSLLLTINNYIQLISQLDKNNNNN